MVTLAGGGARYKKNGNFLSLGARYKKNGNAEPGGRSYRKMVTRRRSTARYKQTHLSQHNHFGVALIGA